MDARGAGDDFADDLMACILGRVRCPSPIVAGSENGHNWGAHCSRHMDRATIVGHDQSTAPNERAEGLRAGRRWRYFAGRADVRGHPPSQVLLISVEPTEDQWRQSVPLVQSSADLRKAVW